MENEGYVKENGNRIIRWGKIFVCIAVWTVVVGGGCFILGRVTYTSKALVVDTNGRVEKQETLTWKLTSNIGECCRERNEILADYNDFLRTPPRVLSVTDTEIRFAIRANEYTLGYRLKKEAEWHWGPLFSGRVRMTSDTICPSMGIGIMGEYAMIGCGLVVNGVIPLKDIDITVLGYVRF